MTQPTENAQATNIKKAFEIVVTEIKALKAKAGEGVASLGEKITALGTRLTTAEENHTALGTRLTTAEENHTALEQRVAANETAVIALKATDQEIKDFLGTTNGDDLVAIMAKLNEE